MTLRRHAHRLTSGDNSSHPPTTRPCAHRACLPTFHVLWNTSSLSRCRLSRAHTRLVYSISFRFSSVAIHFRPAFARLSVCFHCACEFGCPLLFVPCFFFFSYFVDDFPSLLSPASALHFNVPSFLPRPLQLSMVFLVKCFLSLSALQRPQKYIVRSSRPSPLRHLLHTNCFP